VLWPDNISKSESKVLNIRGLERHVWGRMVSCDSFGKRLTSPIQ